LAISTFYTVEPRDYRRFPQRNDAGRRFDCPAFRRPLETGQTNRLHRNLDGRALTGRFENLATPQPFRRSDFRNARSARKATSIKPKIRRIGFADETHKQF
jgi:hypothetical protein